MPRNDVVIDANIMCLYGTTNARQHIPMFKWLDCCGSIAVSIYVLKEYSGQGSFMVAGLLDKLMREGRYAKIKKSTIDAFEDVDGKYRYTCNGQDISVARTVFRSYRKLLISLDQRLREDVARFARVGGVAPRAMDRMAVADMIPKEETCPTAAHNQR